MVLSVLSVDIIAGIVEKYGEVKKLNLSSNGVETLEDLSQLSFLQSLNLSCNAISDVSALSSLPQLIELDLRDNEIASIAPLRKLRGLQRLDISFNSIASMDALRDLAELKQLVCLDMIGNAVCSCADRYAEILFLTIPSLQVVDGRSRADVLGADEESVGNSEVHAPTHRHTPAQPTDDSTPRLSDKLVAEQLLRENEALASKMVHLEDLLVTMERAFSAQEQELSQAAAEDKHSDQLEQDKPAPADGGGGHKALEPVEPSRAELSRGFGALLKLWRRRLLQALVSRAELERELGRALRSVDSARAACNQVSAQHDSLLTESSKKQAVLLAENGELRQHIGEQEKVVSEQQQKVRSLQSSISKKDKDVHLMRLFFEEFRKQLDSNMVNISHKMMQASGSLQLLDARLHSAAQRVELASALVAQKKVNQRNTVASLLAKNASEYPSVPAHRLTEAGLADLAPEAEALLCSIFRQMDPQDYGYVSIQLLVECLLHQQGALLQLVNSALGGGVLPIVLTSRTEDTSALSSGELHWAACGSWAARLLYLLLQLLREVEHSDVRGPNGQSRINTGGDVTWGEFLLLLAISREEDTTEEQLKARLSGLSLQEGAGQEGLFAALSRAESLGLRKRCLLGDHEWAMLPLVIPADAKGLSHGKNPFLPPLWLANAGTSVESVSRLKQEALRLSRERAFLLSRIQDMNRTLERRVLAAKEYFSAEITAAQTQAQRSQRELQESEERLDSLRAQHSEMLSSSRAQIERLTERLASAEAAVAAMRGEEEKARGEVETALHEQLEAQRTKQTRLENEHRLLKKESCKMEVLSKTLQRDVQRLQALYSAEAKSRQEVEDRARECEESMLGAVAENATLKDRILLLEAENERLKCAHNEAAAVRPPPVPEPVVEELSVSPPASAVDNAASARLDRPPAAAVGAAPNVGDPGAVPGASGIAIDAVMQKLREWTNKLDEYDDTRY